MLFAVNSAVITYNAALNRRAYESSVHADTYYSYPARYGNDGSRDTVYNRGTKCALTNGERYPWWAVDLGHPTAIYSVDLTTSAQACMITELPQRRLRYAPYIWVP